MIKYSNIIPLLTGASCVCACFHTHTQRRLCVCVNTRARMCLAWWLKAVSRNAAGLQEAKPSVAFCTSSYSHPAAVATATWWLVWGVRRGAGAVVQPQPSHRHFCTRTCDLSFDGRPLFKRFPDMWPVLQTGGRTQPAPPSTRGNVFGICVHVDTVVIVHVGGAWSALDFYTSHSRTQECVCVHTLLCSAGNHWQCFGCFVTINNCIHDGWWCVAGYKQIFYGCPAWSIITHNIFIQSDVWAGG